ncbi:hypothetical protein IFM89_000810 [Coptis chinensis]|uniref:F-box domain-containing protein n=1 Tax=Coptis chinensis TaxID=261450 RepID=A0A835MGX3_9MAGN|nr:hypothetical protein IFM89_000810 [Coptis chinensis]
MKGTMEGETSSSRDGDNVLPEDVVFQILVCLPVMSLFRFKSVCKSWRILIESSNFIDQQLNHHSHQYSNYNFVTLSPLRHYGPPPIRRCINLCLRSGDRFEVVRFFILPDSPGVTLAEMYNLSTDSWTTIDTGVLHVDYISSDPKAPYRNGSYCWFASKGHPIESDNGEIFNPFILSFDFSSKVFGTMSLPEVDGVKFDTYPQLAILRDNLALINKVDFSYEMGATHFEIWVLNEYGVKESWTKLYKVGHL